LFCLCAPEWLKWQMAGRDVAGALQTLSLVWALKMMSCWINGLFWLVHIVKQSSGRTRGEHVLLFYHTEPCWNRYHTSTLKTQQLCFKKGETIPAESNNTFPPNIPNQIWRYRSQELNA
jgi:hypothetical protein